uniref:non-specific serine/threonine protein kinase n=1 Tax=Leersia perrieri TaxID=77586 RepID=A0A0D9VCD8_9ORYZ
MFLIDNKTKNFCMLLRFGTALVLPLLTLVIPVGSCTKQEQSSLLKFLTGLSQGGSLTTSWQNNTNCCTWEGIICSMDGAVTELLLSSKGLDGKISPSLGELTSLLHLNLSFNSLSGGLPQELVSSNSLIIVDVSFNRLDGSLSELPSSTPSRPLQVLNISSNLFAGNFPSSTWVVMKNLVALHVSNNSLSGHIPTNFCTNSPSLTVLELSCNQFSGSIPPGLGSCSWLRVLKAGHNNLSGTLPNELFSATSLEHLSLPNNDLQGQVEWENLVKLSKLAILDLGENNFTGNIPESIGQLKRLEELHLNNNKMFGDIPSTLSNCTSLKEIDLKSNNFSGELINVDFSNLSNLKTIDLMRNNFNGTIPETIYSCSNLTALRLSSNKFEGQLSKGLGHLKSLCFLSLARNHLTNITNAIQILQSSSSLTTLLIGRNFINEKMPDDDSIDSFKNLQVLTLDNCSLSGKIPRWLSKLSSLKVLSLDNNQLTGQIPDWISSLNFLFYLDISNNNLTGEIPTALIHTPMLRSDRAAAQSDPGAFQLPIYVDESLQYRKTTAFPKVLNLGNNEFSGLIPPDIGQWKELLALNLSFNKLYGDIPQSICNITGLLMLDLSSNNLTGTIPVALNRLNFLTKFNISYNDLEGPIPIGGQLSTFTDSSFYGNPKLCGPMLSHPCTEKAVPAPASTLSTDEFIDKVIFGILIGLFFALGVLLDQMQNEHYERWPLLKFVKILDSKHEYRILRAMVNIARNYFTGVIPPEISQLKALDTLDLSFNSFSGEIPQEICSLTNLETLDLSNNHLTGTIPLGLTKLHFLSAFNVSNNNLEGPIPTGGQFNTFDNSSFIGNAKLCGAMLSHHCSSSKALSMPASTLSTKQYTDNIFFGIAIGLFFALGMLLDQIRSTKLLTDLLGFALVIVCLASSTSSCTDQEKRFLLQFLAGLSNDGGLAVSWQNDTNCCTWEGITCSADMKITEVSLASKGLEGHISPSLGNLSGLLHLNLSHNSLSGELPLEQFISSSIVILDVSFNRLNGALHEFSAQNTIQSLQVLNISSNLFTGQFPSTIWKVMNNLVALNVSNNSFTGKVSSFFCSSAPYITELDLSFNQFGGSVPRDIGNCSMLRVLKGGHNNFNGALPDELFNASLLEYLSFPNNGLNGVLHDANIIKLSKLSVLDLRQNVLRGNIPKSIGQLKRLEELHLGQNDFYGELPSTLSNCTNLKIVDLTFNNLSGDLGNINFSSLSNLTTIDLLTNNFIGTIPESIYACTKLTALRLSKNNFHGELSQNMNRLRSLSFLSIDGNNFTNIRNVLHITKSFINLTMLSLGENFMHEILPEDETIDGFENLHHLSITGKLTNLVRLRLSDNKLTGSVPVWINNLNFLFYLDISNNSFTGEILRTLVWMPMLKSDQCVDHIEAIDTRVLKLSTYWDSKYEYHMLRATLNIARNGFTGVIPPEISELKALGVLDLSFNSFSGEIPQAVCSLTNLEVLHLSNNNLTGKIPLELNNLHFLSSFNVSNNDLEGPIPTGGHNNRNSSFCKPIFGHPLVPLLLISLVYSANSCNEQERSSLLQFLAELSNDGGLGLSWQNGRDCCTWEGIICSSSSSSSSMDSKVVTVTDVLLASKKLEGNISPALGSLPGLLHLNLSHNFLSSSLPSEILSSGSITVLDVSFNSLDGVLPPPQPQLSTGIKQPLRLQVLKISSNKFTAEFPSMDAMENLIALNGSNNSFTGMIPVATLCRASSSLALLDLSDNKFTGKVLKVAMNNLNGTLPAELFEVTSLEHLSLANNGLQGELDRALANLSNLVTLDLGGNNFVAEIPESIGHLKKLEKLNLGNNKMFGNLPSSLSNCASLTAIDLKINNFSGDLGKVDFSTLHNLKILDLLVNNFSGVIPESIYSCSNMTALRLSANHIHGEISSRISDLKHLSFLSLANNSLVDIAKVFHALQSSQNLTSLFIQQNFLDEAIPQTVDGFESLQCLAIRACSLTGKIPLRLSKLNKLAVLDLSNNPLIGPCRVGSTP